jgi:nicotinate-nucleotide adenylyltransferase
MTICLFQGTFNPIHKVHLEVAKFAYEHFGFDKIVFVPAFIPPHKFIDKSLAKHRYNMVKIATEKFKCFSVSDIEFQSDEYSYTYNTIIKLKKDWNITEKINFIIGTDAFEKIQTWYKSEDLKELVHFIVFPRANDVNPSDFEHLKMLGYDFEFAPMQYNDISSTQIRDYIKNGNSIENLEIPEVMEYIKNNELYI